MLNATIFIKLKQRLNKLDSQDYDNIECWQFVEAFNKAQVEWPRRQLHGINMTKEGDEQSTRRIDDLQVLLETYQLNISSKPDHVFGTIPDDYLQWKRVDIKAGDDCCDGRRMVVYLAEEANLNNLLRDQSKNPNFEWGETFATMRGNKVNIYHDGKFDIDNASLVYYRQPIRIQVIDCVDPYTQERSTQEILCEFKDDIVEILIDEAASIIAGDIEAGSQFSRGTQGAERNN